MSEAEQDSLPPQTRTPHSANYYKRILMQGNGTQWRALMQDIKENHEIAFRVAEACGQLKPEYKTVQTLWKTAVETAQPNIVIRIGKDMDEDMKVRGLKRTRFSDGMD